MFCTKNKQTRGGSRIPGSSMMELFVTMEVILYWQSSSNLDDGGIVELPLYAIIFSFHDKIVIMEEEKDQTFHILAPSFSQCEEYNFLLPLLGNSCSLIDPFVFWRFYKVFESILEIFKYSKSVQSPEIFHFETWKLPSHQFWLKKLLPSTKVEVNKPDLRRIYLHTVPD